jgi:hypothetical protein
MEQIIFDYKQQVPFDNKIFYPAADISILGRDGRWRPFTLYVDSGAALTILTVSDAIRLGVELIRGKSVNLYGVSGSVKAYIHQLPVKIGRVRLTIDKAFSVSDETPRLLGREIIFQKFIVSFRESHHKTYFTEEPTKIILLE